MECFTSRRRGAARLPLMETVGKSFGSSIPSPAKVDPAVRSPVEVPPTGRDILRLPAGVRGTAQTDGSSMPRWTGACSPSIPEAASPASVFGAGGAIDLRKGVTDGWPQGRYEVTSPPTIYKDLVITGAGLQEFPSRGPSGAVRAFDVRTGKQVWRFDSVPGPGQVGHDTWEGDEWKDRSGTNVWGIMTVDVERGMVFLPFGCPSYDFYGADRRGQGLFGNSLVALDAATGKLLWYYQMVHHDIW